ncbi:MAG: hypothetical protein QXV46_02805 [Candidatus Bathyarchaeia archaeon]|nr:hypothetical protein [Candidatus Bathyarchaeota archaeon]
MENSGMLHSRSRSFSTWLPYPSSSLSLKLIWIEVRPWDRSATKEDIRLILDFMEKRFEDINKYFGDINKRFEDVNRRFDDLRYYVDKRVGLVEKLLLGFNIHIFIAVVIVLIKLFIT